MRLFSIQIIAVILLFFVGTQDLTAQNQRDGRLSVDKETTESRHEIVPFIRGGISTLHYNVDNGSRTSEFGGGIGVNYIWFFQPRWGLQTGIEWQIYNTRLAAGRVESLVEYLKESGNFGDVTFSTSSVAEDWEGLERMVSASDLSEKEALLAVIRDTEIKDYDIREAKLSLISGGVPYRELLEKIYPALRRTDYTIDYTIRNFTLEESKSLFMSAPEQLSLEEMFRVAQTFATGSDEFIRVFEKAVEIYPDDPVSNLNAANAALMRKDAEAARKHLAKAQEGREKQLAQEALRKIDGWLEIINGQ